MATRRTVLPRPLVLAVCLPVLALPLVSDAGPYSQTSTPWLFTAWAPVPENPVFTGTGRDTWDRKIRERGYILVDQDDTYHLWYTGYAGDRPQTMSLGHATSRDGIHWARDPANPIFADSWVEDMCVVPHDGTYFMFAEGKNDIAHLLTSTDGRKWADLGSLDIRKTDGNKIDPGPFGTPTAWFEKETWYLFYERGDQGIWLATSKDLKVWTNVKDDPVIAMGPRLSTSGPWPLIRSSSAMTSIMLSTTPMPTSPGKTGRLAWPARTTWFTGKNTQATP